MEFHLEAPDSWPITVSWAELRRGGEHVDSILAHQSRLKPKVGQQSGDEME